MRKLVLSVLSILCVVGVLASAHIQAAGKKYNDQITLSTDVKVGGQTLKAGDYKITCDDNSVTFVRLVPTSDDPGHLKNSGDKPVVVQATTSPLTKKVTDTEFDSPAGADGAHVLATLRVRGSSVEYKFN
jgi:hypothetical protein